MYKGLRLTSWKILEIYAPIIPKIIIIIPPINNIEAIKLGHPKTVNPQLKYPIITQADKINEKTDKIKPRPIANFKGLSEKAIKMSVANLTLFLKV